jgi:hypothetical protein
MKWKYQIEVQKKNGKWSLGTIWEVDRADFRQFLAYINGENDPSDGNIMLQMVNPPVRIKHVSNSEIAQFSWPEDSLTYLETKDNDD